MIPFFVLCGVVAGMLADRLFTVHARSRLSRDRREMARYSRVVWPSHHSTEQERDEMDAQAVWREWRDEAAG